MAKHKRKKTIPQIRIKTLYRLYSEAAKGGHAAINSAIEATIKLDKEFNQSWMKEICRITCMERNNIKNHRHIKGAQGRLKEAFSKRKDVLNEKYNIDSSRHNKRPERHVKSHSPAVKPTAQVPPRKVVAHPQLSRV